MNQSKRATEHNSGHELQKLEYTDKGMQTAPLLTAVYSLQCMVFLVYTTVILFSTVFYCFPPWCKHV